jgi:hypothetical protein
VIDSPDFPEWIKPGSKATSNALEQLRNEQELVHRFLETDHMRRIPFS